MPIITLLTDYGITDSYVAEVKGAILSINPRVTIIDISHDVGNYEIKKGAFHLARSVMYFPKNTVHVGVVDPTVGSERSPIIIKAKDSWLVGPDNGLMAPAAERLGIEKLYKIKGHPEFPKKISKVFDGRDTFGPAGALLSRGVSPEEIGEPIDDVIRLTEFRAKITNNVIHGKFIHTDGFGNCVTNITFDIIEELGVEPMDKLDITIYGKRMNLPYVHKFSSVPVGNPLLLVAGGGFLELSVNQGNAAEKFNIEEGISITLEIAD